MLPTVPSVLLLAPLKFRGALLLGLFPLQWEASSPALRSTWPLGKALSPPGQTPERRALGGQLSELEFPDSEFRQGWVEWERVAGFLSASGRNQSGNSTVINRIKFSKLQGPSVES